MLVAVNLDPHHAQGATSRCRSGSSAFADDAAVDVEDLVDRQQVHLDRARSSTCSSTRMRPYPIWRLSTRQDRA